MSEEEMNKFFCKIDKRLRSTNFQGRTFLRSTSFKNQDITSILGVFNNIKQSVGSWKEVTGLYMRQCSTQHFSLPFQAVLHLLGKRQVRLDRGMAVVSFSKLREVMKEQFLSLMQLAAEQASEQLPVALADNRLKILWRKLKVSFQYLLRSLKPLSQFLFFFALQMVLPQPLAADHREGPAGGFL